MIPNPSMVSNTYHNLSLKWLRCVTTNLKTAAAAFRTSLVKGQQKIYKAGQGFNHNSDVKFHI